MILDFCITNEMFTYGSVYYVVLDSNLPYSLADSEIKICRYIEIIVLIR